MSFVAGAGAVNVDLLYNNIELPNIGEEVYTDDFSIKLGGGLPATLINIGRLGIPIKLACELGNDMFSLFAQREINQYTTPLNLYKGDMIPVNITSVLIHKKDRSFISYGKGGLTYSKEAENAFYNMAKGAKICYMEANGFINAYKKLKADGTVLVFDTGWSDDLSIDKYRDYIELADYYTPNRKEALKITGTESIEDALEELKKHFIKVIIKLDCEGCLGYDGELFTVPPIDEFKCVDSTGAGDAFLAGFVYGLYYDYSFKDCILLGNLTGGKAVTGIGALSSYLTEKELLKLSEQYKKQG
jgi:sugar/nucleoside kinase (ribokinase family)